MTIFINGEMRDTGDAASLSALLDRLDLPGQRVAIELNKKVIRKQDWETTPIAENDRIEIVYFVGGG